MWFLVHSVSYRKALIVFQTKIKVSMEVTLYSPHLLPTSTSNQSKEMDIFNFRFVINVNVPPKGFRMLIFQRNVGLGEWALTKLPSKSSHARRRQFNIPPPPPPHHHLHHPVNGLPYISSKWITLYLNFSWTYVYFMKLSSHI